MLARPRQALHTGGCQCGRVRYALFKEPSKPHVCHCRMCQKAFGNYFAPFASVALTDFEWTRGVAGRFMSSEIVERGYCRDCGTPMSFRYTNLSRIGIALGSLDHPERLPPILQYGIESRMPFLTALGALPGHTTEELMPDDLKCRIISRQHPDEHA